MQLILEIEKKIKKVYMDWRKLNSDAIPMVKWGNKEDVAVGLVRRYDEETLRAAASMAGVWERHKRANPNEVVTEKPSPENIA